MVVLSPVAWQDTASVVVTVSITLFTKDSSYVEDSLSARLPV